MSGSEVWKSAGGPVEAETGVTLAQDSVACQGRKFVAWIKLPVMFGDHGRVGGQKGRLGEVLQHLSVELLQAVRWIEKDEVSTYVAALQLAEGGYSFIVEDLKTAVHLQCIQVPANQIAGRRGGVYEINVGSASAQGLDTDCTCAGEYIHPDCAVEIVWTAGGKDIKKSFTQAVSGRAEIQTAHGAQPTTAKFAGDHAHENAAIELISDSGTFDFRRETSHAVPMSNYIEWRKERSGKASCGTGP